MDGFALLLFTFVPIRLFSWTMAIVFTALGVRVLRRGLDESPTLAVSASGLRLPDGTVSEWDTLGSIAVGSNGLLEIEVAPRAGGSSESTGLLRLPRRLLRGRNEPVALSSFDLGAEPERVLEEIEKWRVRSRES